MSILLHVAAAEAERLRTGFPEPGPRHPEPASPTITPVPPATAPPDRMAGHEAARLHAARFHAPRRYPGPVGEYLAAELKAAADFGYRLAGSSLLARIVDDLLKPPA